MGKKEKRQPFVSAVIVAAGRGRRMGSERNKLLLPIFGRSVLAFTLQAFEECMAVDEVVIVAAEEDMSDFCAIVTEEGFSKVKSIVRGGKERQFSVYAGLQDISPEVDIVAIHDGARAMITPELIEDTIRAAAEDGAAAIGVPVKDTLKLVGENGTIEATIDREKIWAVQTPQVFRKEIILMAHEKALADGFLGTDDCSLAERLGIPVTMVEGSYDNLKLTTKEDMRFAASILEQQLDF